MYWSLSVKSMFPVHGVTLVRHTEFETILKAKALRLTNAHIPPLFPPLVCFARATRTATSSLRLWTRLDTKTALSRCLQNDNIAITRAG